MDNDSLLLQALNFKSLIRPPVWLMRQAGRYMSEYRDLKSKHSFLELCHTPALAVEVTMQPIRYLNVDAAIIFSDILIPLQGMGFLIDFNPGPQVANPIMCPDDLKRCVVPEQDPNGFVYEAISQAKNELLELPQHPHKALLGFAGAPWTLTCYAIGRGPYKHFESAQIFAVEHPTTFHTFQEKLSAVVGEYLTSQLRAGADVVQLFDSWGGNLSVAEYRRFSLPYIQQIVQQVHAKNGKLVLYVGNSNHLLETLRESGADAISVDWRVSLADARRRLGDGIAVQGNYDPTLLFGGPEEVRARTKAMLLGAPRVGYIANLGHGILQTTPPENARAFVETILNFSH